MTKMRISRRLLSLVLCVALLMSYAPLSALAATRVAQAATVTDPGTAHSWETMMGTDADGNRYAGRVWVDKSIYKDGDTVLLNSKNEAGSSFTVALEEDEAFQVVFSALGSTMTTTESTTSTGPIDVVLVLDTSTSMDEEDSNDVTRLERTITAANKLIDDLLALKNVRLAIVTYNKDSETVLPLAAYNNGIDLKVNNYYNNGRAEAGVVYAYDNSNILLGKDDGYTMGTNLQSGIDRGFNILANATDIQGRVPVAIVLTDGQANRASQEGFYEIASHNDKDGTSASNRNLYLSTLLNAAYTKTKIEEHYGKDATVYTVGVDVSGNTVAQLLMNPADSSNGFHDYGNNRSKSEITQAYRNFQTWASGQNVTYSNWTFNHSYPTQNGKITDAKIAANIYYTDTYYDVSNAELDKTFAQIYEELSSGVFNPISSSTSVSGATGVDDTPLIYVDFIGAHMEIKEIQSVTLFGASYGVIKKADGTYTVDAGTGVNPTTGEAWNTAEDILITVTEQADGTQKLEIRINQEILPIILEQVVSETVGEQTTATITEFVQNPLRVYYTVGVDSDILLPNGKVDVSKIQGYANIDDVNGTVSFYGGQFGVMNPATGGVVTKGDAHVGFRPSLENRYYYHQTNQGIFTKITNKSDGSTVTIPENDEYGIVWDDTKYDLTWMTYGEYQNMQDNQKVYTYVTYYHPTSNATDAANAAEEVTYLVYNDWAYLKESVTFYDANAKVYLNDGKAITLDQVAAAVAAYQQNNPNAEIYAVLGVGSHRTSRLHNMMVNKTTNNTQTAVERYAPEYTYDTASIHNGNDVVVWLGNNGRLTVEIETGIALTKAVTEAIGNADDTYALTVTVPAGVVANPVVTDANGNTVASTYSGNVLTVNVKAGETVYVSGIPGGTQCAIGEIVNGDYYIASKTDTVTIPLVSQALNGAAQFASATVTNAPHKYGNLFITKEITSEHTVPGAVLDTPFYITVNVGTALAGKTFSVEDSAHAAPYSVTVDNAGDMTFRIKARQTVEILRLPAGTAVTVTEADPGSHFAVSYRTRNHSGETADADNALAIPANGSATAVVLNHYTPGAVSVDLDVVINKTFADESVKDRLQGGTFTFAVYKYSVANPIAEGQLTYAAQEFGTKSVVIENVLGTERFTEAGTWSYHVMEQKGSSANISYDRAVYTFDVVVTDNGGQLEAKVIDTNNTEIKDTVGDGALDYITQFTNTYDTAPISMDIRKVIFNMSGDSAVSAAGFQFKSIAVDANGDPLVPNQINTIYSDAAGEARISGVYTRAQIGTHYYIVYEENTNKPGWRYSEAQYFVTVVVADVEGELTATMTIVPYNEAASKELAPPIIVDGNAGMLYFSNAYDPEDVVIDLNGMVNKELTGKTLEKDAFTFFICEDGTAEAVRSGSKDPILVGKNDENGNVSFAYFDQSAEEYYQGKIHIAQVGKISLDIIEAIPAGATYDAATGKYVLNGMYYDATIYDLVVEATNDLTTGKLSVSCYFEDAVSNVVTFRNAYKATSTEYTLGGTKVLHGRSPRDGEFTFELYEGTELKQTVTNKADGSFAFKTISYTAAGTYTYTIKEAQGDAAGVRYDGVNKPVTVTVTVTDTNGVLSAAANIQNADIKFENTYTAKSAQVTFNGTKEFKGGTLADNAFTFKLYKTDNTFDIAGASAQLLATAKNVGGAFSFARELAATGTYYFVIVEDTAKAAENVVYDRTVHKFAVQVSDVGDGQLKAVVINVTTGVSTASAASVSASVGFVNATFDEVTEKEVYHAGSTATQIDGQKVNAGDILTYFITYTNYTGENAVVDIMDTIPAHTTYVEGSASHGGTYAGTHLNWILNVNKGESVTVSFNVKVNETEAIVANTAVVRDGTNTYKTNEVVNHTVEKPLVKEVFNPADLTASVDGKKVYAGDELLYQICFTNASGDVADIKITDKIPANTTYVAGSADNGGAYANGEIVWNIRNVPAWATVTVAFKVTVNADVKAAALKNQATATDGTNNYQTNVVTNYTVEDEVEKKVFNAEAPTVNIDGKPVKNGDTLVYTIRYKNTAAEKATVTITDTIPQHTTYVDGSADNAGVYANGEITWTLEVAAGAEVTVAFKVKVTSATDGAITNKAVVVEGKNTYTTNEVSTTNTNPVPPVEPEVPTEPSGPSNPQTGDTNLLMWFALLFVSCGGFVTVAFCSRKKKETEMF